MERTKDKLTRVMDAVSSIEAGFVVLPEDAPFASDFLVECEAFTADDSHAHDDQIDPMCDAITDMLLTKRSSLFDFT
ncbi:phage-related protein [Fimbriiglobus ruber]|uniref:Phage-related protein n=1 Tax=Fimbriiglobus ruber TaxID=1908690 RepID=A0A225DL18_9BACT|nr:phage-related protein [Fimbriiglobus ruber]